MIKNNYKKSYLFFKRFFDIVSSFLLLFLLMWLILLTALLVKITSRGPVFFIDKRVGKDGKIINVYKFRSMFIDAENRLEKYLTPEQKIIWERERKIENDPRITKFGKFIRKTSLDELPQLFNIFLGTMSVVGPRPITLQELNENFTLDEMNILLSARPGLISYWGVNGRSHIDFKSKRRQELELEYFSKRSFWFDISLILKAIPKVISGRGAK